jgi:thioredoxin 1
MKNSIMFLILLASLLFTSGCIQNPQENSTNHQDTQNKSAVVEVAQLEQINASLQKGPVLLELGAEWCEDCQALKPTIDKIATEYDGRVTVMSIDVDKSPKLADYFGVSSVPDSSVIVGIENNEYVYMQEDGNITKDRFKARILGPMDKGVYEKILNLVLQNRNSEST